MLLARAGSYSKSSSSVSSGIHLGSAPGLIVVAGRPNPNRMSSRAASLSIEWAIAVRNWRSSSAGWGWPTPAPEVEGDLVEATLVALDHGQVGVLPQALHGVGGDPVGGVELARLQGGHHRLRVGEEAEDHGVDGDRAAPVVRVGGEAEELARPVLVEHERTAAHPVIGGIRAQVAGAAGGDRLPDVPGEDVGVHGGEPGVGLGGDDLHGALVEGGGGEVAGDGCVVEPLLLRRGVDGPRHVVGGERLSVRPQQTLAQRVGDGEAVLGDLPRLGEAGNGGEVLRRLVGERGVLERPELVLGDQETGGDVERVQRLGEPDGEDDLVLVLGAGCRRHQGDQDDQCDQSKGPAHVSDLQTRHETFAPEAASRRRSGHPSSTSGIGQRTKRADAPPEVSPSSGHSARRASAGMVRGAS